MGDDWTEVRRLRREAEDYARKGDELAAAMLDGKASRMGERLRALAATMGETDI